MARITLAQALARIEHLEAALAAAPARSSVSAHWTARDLPCSAAKPCKRTFRTAKGRDWHVANIRH